MNTKTVLGKGVKKYFEYLDRVELEDMKIRNEISAKVCKIKEEGKRKSYIEGYTIGYSEGFSRGYQAFVRIHKLSSKKE